MTESILLQNPIELVHYVIMDHKHELSADAFDWLLRILNRLPGLLEN